MRKKEQGRRHGFEIEKERARGRVSENRTKIGPKTKKKKSRKDSLKRKKIEGEKEKMKIYGDLWRSQEERVTYCTTFQPSRLAY